MLQRLALIAALACCAPVLAKPAPKAAPKVLPDHVEEVDYLRWQAAMWKDQAAQLELEAAQRRAMAAQAAAADSKGRVEALKTELNKQYALTPADSVADPAPHKITRAK